MMQPDKMSQGGNRPTIFNIAGNKVGLSVIPQGPQYGPQHVAASSTTPRAHKTGSLQGVSPLVREKRNSPSKFVEKKFAYSVKIYNPARRSEFTWRDLHDVSHRFSSIGALRLALYHELEDDIPDDDDYNLGYFEGKQQKKKWLVSSLDLDAMYACFEGKQRISLWCDGKQPPLSEYESSNEDGRQYSKRKKKTKNSRKQRKSKADEREEELENIFQQLKKKHESKFSGPQLRLWARMIVAKTHDDMDEPPKVPMITGAIQKSQPKESIVDAFVSAASAVAKVFSPSQTAAITRGSQNVPLSPGKKLDLRMKNLEQLRQLQKLLEDGVLSQEEFDSQKKIVVLSLNSLV